MSHVYKLILIYSGLFFTETTILILIPFLQQLKIFYIDFGLGPTRVRAHGTIWGARIEPRLATYKAALASASFQIFSRNILKNVSRSDCVLCEAKDRNVTIVLLSKA